MKRLCLFIGVCLLVLAWSGPGRANLINGGFETGGDLTGWTYDANTFYAYTTGFYGSVAATLNPGENVPPLIAKEGLWFAGLFQEIEAKGVENGTVYIPHGGWLTQEVYVPAGGKLMGSAAFVPAWPYYGGYGYVQVGTDVVWHSHYDNESQVATWEDWQWTAPAAGTYTLKLAEVNPVNLGGPPFYSISYACFDDIQVVPLPSSLLLLGSGLAAFGLRRRRKKA